MDSLLRDINREQAKMKVDVDNLYRHYEKLHDYVYQHLRNATVEWAGLLIDHPKAVILVIETTQVVGEHGYINGESEPIRLTALSLADGQVWDQLVHPTHSHEVRGFEYHGLTILDLEDQPYLASVWPYIREQLEDRRIIIFGADYARSALRNILPTARILDSAFCLHNKAKEFYGEFYELSLEKILAYQGVDKKRHELKDSRDRIQMLAQIIRNLSKGMEKVQQEPDDNSLGDLSERPF